jgi:hypothetical protein
VLQSLNQLQRQTKKESNSIQEEYDRCHERGDAHGRDGYSRSASISHGHHSPSYLGRNFYASDDPVRNPEVSLVRLQRRKQEIDSLQGEMRKLKPPSFDG